MPNLSEIQHILDVLADIFRHQLVHGMYAQQTKRFAGGLCPLILATNPRCA